MKIALPLKNEKDLANDFSEALFIGVYDTEKSKIEYFSIPTIQKHIGMSCFFDVMSTQGLKAVVSPYYNYMVFSVFKESRIEPFKARGYSLDDNIWYFERNELKVFDLSENFQIAECSKDCKECSIFCYMC